MAGAPFHTVARSTVDPFGDPDRVDAVHDDGRPPALGHEEGRENLQVQDGEWKAVGLPQRRSEGTGVRRPCCPGTMRLCWECTAPFGKPGGAAHVGDGGRGEGIGAAGASTGSSARSADHSEVGTSRRPSRYRPPRASGTTARHLGDHRFVPDEEGRLAVGQEVCLFGGGQGSVHPDPDHTEPHAGMKERNRGRSLTSETPSRSPCRTPAAIGARAWSGGPGRELTVGQTPAASNSCFVGRANSTMPRRARRRR